MSEKVDQVNIQVNINGDNARNKLNELNKESKALAKELKDVTYAENALRKEKELAYKELVKTEKATGSYSEATRALRKEYQIMVDASNQYRIQSGELNNKLSDTAKKMDEVKKSIGFAGLSLKELNRERTKLTALRDSANPLSQEFKDYDAQLKKVVDRQYEVRNGVTGLAKVFSKVKDEVKQFGALAAGYLGLQFITTQFRSIIQGAGKLSDQLADVRRVTGLTADETDKLNRSLKELDTRTSTSSLRDIAIIAGKLGVASGDILEFTKAVDMLVVSLGDELGDADQITTTLGKILNVFDGKITGDNITRLGNAFVELANSGAATGGFIADFSQRLSGIAKSAGIGLGAIAGLGAGLEEMGGRVESSATAVQKLIISVSKDMPAAAKVAGMAADEFDRLFKIDPTEAILRYSEGLVKNKESFAEVTAGLAEAGETGARTIETISKLGAGADQLRTRVKLGTEALKENGAITEAFALKNENLGAALDKLSKEFNRLVTSSTVINFLKAAVDGATNLIRLLKQLPEILKENRIMITFLVTALILKNKQLLISNGLWLANKIAVGYDTAAVAINTAIVNVHRMALAAMAIVQALSTGNTLRAAAAWRVFTRAFAASGIGTIVVAVAALGYALDSLVSKTNRMQKLTTDFNNKAIEAYGDQVNEVERLKAVLDSSNISLDQKKVAYEKLIAINPEFRKTLTLDIDGHLQGAEAVDIYIASLKRKGEMQAAQELSNEKYKDVLKEQEKYDRVAERVGKNGNKGSIGDQMDMEKAKEAVDKAKEAKDYYDKKIEEMYTNGPATGTMEFTMMPDTVVPGSKSNAMSADVAKRKAELEKLIKDTEEAYLKLNATDKKGQAANLALQKRYKDELDALMGVEKKGGRSSAKNNDYERLLADAKKFQEELQKLKRDTENAGKSADERDLIALQEKYDELHKKALEFYKKNALSKKQYTEEEKLLEETFQIELAALQKKQFDKVSGDEYAASIESSKQYFDEQRVLEGQRYADGLQSKAEYDAALRDLDLVEKKQLINVAEGYAKNVTKAETDLAKLRMDLAKATTAEEIAQAEARIRWAESEAIAKRKLAVLAAPTGTKKRVNAEKDLLGEMFTQDTALLDKNSELYKQKYAEYQAGLKEIDHNFLQDRIDRFDDYAQQVMSITTTLFTALDNLDQRQFAKDKAINDAKKNNYKKQLDSKLLSQRQYDAKIAKSDEELAAKKKELDLKAFKRQQVMAVTAALINGAIAVTSTLAARPGVADIATLGILRAVQVGLVIAATAAQVAAIATQAPPQAARGKWFRKGKKHRDGGIDVEIEKDEAVIMAKTMTDNTKYTVSGTPAQITSKLNSMHGGEAWSQGAVLRPKFREAAPQIRRDMPQILEQQGIVRQMYPEGSSADSKSLENMIERKFNEMIAVTKDKADRLRADVSVKEFRRTEKQYDNAKKAGSMGQ